MINRLKDLDNFYLIPNSYYRQVFEDSFTMDTHAHQYIELMYCQSGNCSVIISKKTKDGFQEIEVKLGKKYFIIIDAGAYHKLKINKNESCVLYNIEWDVVPSNSFTNDAKRLINLNTRLFLDKFDGLKKFAYSSNKYISALDSENLEHYISQYINQIQYNDHSLTNECNVITRFIQLFVEMDKCLTSNQQGGKIIYIKKAEEYIKNNYTKDLSIEEIASYAGIHKAYLQRLYKAYMGMSILQSLNNYRISKCKNYLIETNLTIEEICPHTGFNNRQQLIYEFKKHTGTTPSEYKNNYLSREYRYSPENYISKDINDTPIY